MFIKHPLCLLNDPHVFFKLIWNLNQPDDKREDNNLHHHTMEPQTPTESVVSDDDFFNALDTPKSQPDKPQTTLTPPRNEFRVYNPVDGNYEEWPQDAQESSFEQILGKDTPERKGSNPSQFFEHILGRDGADSDSFRENSDFGNSTPNNASEEDDTALARAIAEQDLPPGVSASEQQEVMMRLLTQQLRRGDWSEEEGGLPPELEQRLRE